MGRRSKDCHRQIFLTRQKPSKKSDKIKTHKAGRIHHKPIQHSLTSKPVQTMGGIISSTVYTYKGLPGERVPKGTTELRIAEGVTKVGANCCEAIITLKKVRSFATLAESKYQYTFRYKQNLLIHRC